MGRRRNRETVRKDPKSKILQGKQLRWSVWHEAIVPKNVVFQDKYRFKRRNYIRRSVWQHYYNNKTLQKLKRSCNINNCGRCCGVYELKVVATVQKGKSAVVYVGSTHRRTGKSLYQRLSKYMKHGNHIKKIIQEALDQNFQIHVRWIKIPEDLCPGEDEQEDREAAENLENAYLDKYDYAWNKRRNDKRRKILGINVET